MSDERERDRRLVASGLRSDRSEGLQRDVLGPLDARPGRRAQAQYWNWPVSTAGKYPSRGAASGRTPPTRDHEVATRTAQREESIAQTALGAAQPIEEPFRSVGSVRAGAERRAPAPGCSTGDKTQHREPDRERQRDEQ